MVYNTGDLRSPQTANSILDYSDVKPYLRRIDAYSAHADYEEMIRYISCQNKKKLKKIFLVHGEEETQVNFRDTLNKNGFKEVEIPSFREAYTL